MRVTRMSTAPIAPVTPAASDVVSVSAPKPVARASGRAALLTIVFVLLSRVLGVVRSMVIASAVGQNEWTDIYRRAFAIPDTLYLMMAGGALSTVFIPIFTHYLQNNEEEKAWETFGRVATLVAVAVTGIILITELLAYPLARLVAPQFSSGAVAEMVPLTRTLIPAQFFFFVGSLVIATLQSRERWLIPNIAPLVYNGGIIVAGLLFKSQGPAVTVQAMTWGAVIGAGIGNFLLPVLDLIRSKARWRFALDIKHEGVAKFLNLLLPAMLGIGLSQLGMLITGFFLGEGGQITALSNGYELTQAPIGIFAQASALVLFPTLSRLAAVKDWNGMRDELDAGLRRILFLTIPASLLMAILAEPIITLLYAGPRFGAHEVAAAAMALRMYSVGTFAWSAQAVLGRGFFAMHDTRTPLSITKWMIGLFVSLCLIVWLLHLPFWSFALAMSIVGTVNALWLLVALRHRLTGLNLTGIAISAARIVAVAAAASALAGFVSHFFPLALPDVTPVVRIEKTLADAKKAGEPPDHIAAIDTEAKALRKQFAAEIKPIKIRGGIATLLAGGLGVLAYGILAFLLRVPELRTIRALFRRAQVASVSPADGG